MVAHVKALACWLRANAACLSRRHTREELRRVVLDLRRVVLEHGIALHISSPTV